MRKPRYFICVTTYQAGKTIVKFLIAYLARLTIDLRSLLSTILAQMALKFFKKSS